MKNVTPQILRILVVALLLLSPYSFAEKIVRLNVQESLDSKGNQLELDPRLLNILHAIEQESQLKFKLVMLPWKRAQQETANGNGIIWGIKKTTARQQIFQFSEIVAYQKVWAFTYGSEPSSINSARDLEGKTICVSRGMSHGSEFEHAKVHIFKVQDDVASNFARFRKLMAKRCDALLLPVRKLISRVEVRDYINRQFSDELLDQTNLHESFIPSNQPLFLETIHFASANGQNTDIMEQLNRVILKLQRDEKFRQLINNFY